MSHIFVPSGRLPTKKRDFHSVIADIRHAVFSVVRFRPSSQQQGLFDIFTLGSGFFVSSEVFITCWHVIDQPANAHQPGDKYQLVANLPGNVPIALPVAGDIGTDVHLFPDKDLAIIICKARKDQPYMSISYAEVAVGSEIGVAGYPLAQLSTDAKGNPNINKLVYRVAKGVTTAVFNDTIDSNDGHPLIDVPIVEVNFLFVPGNSGGPVFDAETGRAIAYVKGFRSPRIQEKVEQAFPQTQLPAGMANNYISCVHAVYSIGLTLDRIRTELEQFGVKL
jgi:hypothetical protein